MIALAPSLVRSFAGWLAAVGLVVVAGCDAPGKPAPASRPVPDNQIVDFQTLYQTHCAGCHGKTGQMGPAPPLADPLFLAIVPDDELRRVIAVGRPGTPMPGFAQAAGGRLADEQVEALAAGLKQQWASAVVPRQSPPPYHGAAVANTTGDNPAAALYARACAECHGDDGQGVEGMAGAINELAFLDLISDQALRRLIITGRPDLGMPDFAADDGRPSNFQPLTSDEIDALVAWLANWRAEARRTAPRVARQHQP